MEAEATLRDSLTEAYDSVEQEPASPAPQESGQIRDEAGRFAAKESTAQVAEAAKPGAEDTTVHAPSTVEPRKVPSTWKKDYHEHFQKLDPTLADYILERESQYANGVSTYKQEVDRYKPLDEAVQPFMEELRAHNLQPAQWIRQIGEVHQRLVRGNPEQKIQTLQWLANNYGVSLNAIQTGQPDQIMTHLSPLQEELRAVKSELTTWKQQQEEQQMTAYQRELQEFAAKHEHYEAVRETMAGLLQSGVAKDLQSAYDKSIRLNDDVWKSEQLRLQNAQAEQARQEAAEKVKKARSNAVSVRSATPGAMSSGGNSDLRSSLSEAFDAHVGGRV